MRWLLLVVGSLLVAVGVVGLVEGPASAAAGDPVLTVEVSGIAGSGYGTARLYVSGWTGEARAEMWVDGAVAKTYSDVTVAKSGAASAVTKFSTVAYGSHEYSLRSYRPDSAVLVEVARLTLAHDGTATASAPMAVLGAYSATLPSPTPTGSPTPTPTATPTAPAPTATVTATATATVTATATATATVAAAPVCGTALDPCSVSIGQDQRTTDWFAAMGVASAVGVGLLAVHVVGAWRHRAA